MLLYIGLFIIISLGAFLDITNANKKHKMCFFIFFGFICTTLSGMRWETGTDWIPYLDFFSRNHTLLEFVENEYGFEIGYAVFNFLVKSVTDQYNVFLFIMALIIVSLKYRSIFLYSSFPLVSLCLNFANYNGDIFPVRQGIAIAIVLFSSKFIVNKKIVLFLWTVIFASTFHMTALIFLPAYLIYHVNYRRKVLMLFLVASILIGSTGAITMLIESLIIQFGNGEYLMAFKMAEYLIATENDNNFGAAASNTTTILLGIARRGFFLPFLIYLKDRFRDEKINRIYNGFLNLNIFGCIFYFLLSGVSATIAGRGSVYYAIYEIFVIPYIFLMFRGKFSRICIFVVFSAYCLMKYYYGLFGYYDLYIPFHSIFDNFFR